MFFQISKQSSYIYISIHIYKKHEPLDKEFEIHSTSGCCMPVRKSSKKRDHCHLKRAEVFRHPEGTFAPLIFVDVILIYILCKAV